jgi:solute carrier family 25 carnitine/acylcarnitine transporter 20/29
MSAATTTDAASLPRSHHDGQTELPKKAQPAGNYKGFVAGVFSGIAKLTGSFQNYISPAQNN